MYQCKNRQAFAGSAEASNSSLRVLAPQMPCIHRYATGTNQNIFNCIRALSKDAYMGLYAAQ